MDFISFVDEGGISNINEISSELMVVIIKEKK